MRMEVEKVICDRCGKEIGEGENTNVVFDFQTAARGHELDHVAGFTYNDLCPRCMQTVVRRLEAAGPLKNAPRWKGEGDAT